MFQARRIEDIIFKNIIKEHPEFSKDLLEAVNTSHWGYLKKTMPIVNSITITGFGVLRISKKNVKERMLKYLSDLDYYEFLLQEAEKNEDEKEIGRLGKILKHINDSLKYLDEKDNHVVTKQKTVNFGKNNGKTGRPKLNKIK